MPIQFLPIIIGAGLTLGGTALKSRDASRARKRADRANSVLRRNQRKFEEEANQNLLTTAKKFGSEEREKARNEVIQADEVVLGASLGRDRGDFATTPTGNVSNQFIDRKAGTQRKLDDRASRKAFNLAKVLAPGRTGFDEKRGLLRSGQKETTSRILQRGQLGVDQLKVDEAGRVDPNLLADALIGVGSAVATGGALGGFGAGAGSLTPGVTAALTPATAVNTALGTSSLATGLTGLQGLSLPAGLTVQSLNNPRRGFSRAN